MNKSKNSLISSDLLVMAVFALLGFSLIWGTTQKIYHNYELQQQVDELESEIVLLEIQNQNLAYSIEYYQTDAYLELEAREKFNKAKPGERVALLQKDVTVSLPETPVADEPVVDDRPQYQSNFSSWWDFLFGSVN